MRKRKKPIEDKGAKNCPLIDKFPRLEVLCSIFHFVASHGF